MSGAVNTASSRAMGMRLIVAFFAVMLAAASAHAADTIACLDAQNQPQTVSPTYPCSVMSSASAPAVKGFGTLAATNASTLISTLTPGPNSAAWPTVPGMIWLKNAGDSAGFVYFCPLGGMCATSGANKGLILEIGANWGLYRLSTNATAIATSTANLQAQW